MIHHYHTVARYAETDMMGIIHHSVYAVWAEAARTDLMKTMGFSYTEIEKSGIMLPVTEINFHYRRPTHYEDEVTIQCSVTNLDPRRLTIHYKMFVKDQLCCTGYSKHIFMNAQTRSSMRINNEILDNFKEYYNIDFI